MIERLTRSLSFRLLAIFLLLAIVPLVLSQLQGRRLGCELEEARRLLAELQPGQEEAIQRGEELGSELEVARQDLEAQTLRYEEDLATQRQEQERLLADLDRARSPLINPLILALSVERSAPGQAEPTVQFSLPDGSEPIVLLLRWEGPDYPTYRAALTGPGGSAVWEGTGLVRNGTLGALALRLPSTLLGSGDFLLRIDGLTAQGEAVPLAPYSFRVLP